MIRIYDIDKNLDKVPATIALHNAAAKIARNIADALDGKYYTRRLDDALRACAIDGYTVTGGISPRYGGKDIYVLIYPAESSRYCGVNICTTDDRHINGAQLRKQADHETEQAAQIADALAAYAVNRELYERAQAYLYQLEHAISPLQY